METSISLLVRITDALNNFLFIGLPYIALAVFLVGSIWRYRSTGFTISSLSAQFLETRKGFWGTVPFHIGILVVLVGHLVAFMFPRSLLLWNSHPVRLVILEVSAFIFGLLVLIGLAGLFVRRISNPRLRVVTSRMDLAIEILLLLQVVLGLWTALGYRWGSSWFASDLSPYLWSVLKLNPEIAAVSMMPLVVKLHIVGAYVIVLMVPFTRLMHFLVAPVHYLWRPYQRVIWYWDRKKIRDSETAWNVHPPRNN